VARVSVKEHGMPIEQLAPDCARLVDLDQEVEWLASGFGADFHEFACIRMKIPGVAVPQQI
jgi:hypothetical protein